MSGSSWGELGAGGTWGAGGTGGAWSAWRAGAKEQLPGEQRAGWSKGSPITQATYSQLFATKWFTCTFRSFMIYYGSFKGLNSIRQIPKGSFHAG